MPVYSSLSCAETGIRFFAVTGACGQDFGIPTSDLKMISFSSFFFLTAGQIWKVTHLSSRCCSLQKRPCCLHLRSKVGNIISSWTRLLWLHCHVSGSRILFAFSLEPVVTGETCLPLVSKLSQFSFILAWTFISIRFCSSLWMSSSLLSQH